MTNCRALAEERESKRQVKAGAKERTGTASQGKLRAKSKATCNAKLRVKGRRQKHW